MSDRILLDTDGVIARLNVTLDWWRHNRRVLTEKLGFPAPIKGIPHHWDPRAIDAWLDVQLPEYAQPRPHGGLPTIELKIANEPRDWEDELSRRLDAARADGAQ